MHDFYVYMRMFEVTCAEKYRQAQTSYGAGFLTRHHSSTIVAVDTISKFQYNDILLLMCALYWSVLTVSSK